MQRRTCGQTCKVEVQREKERGRKRPQSLEQNKFTFSENVFSAGATFAAATKATAITHTPTHTHKHTLAHVARGRVRERERRQEEKCVWKVQSAFNRRAPTKTT